MKKEYKDFNKMDTLVQKRLESLLVKRNISRRQLAQKVGISEDYLGKMMRGIRPWKLIYLKQVADGLDVPLDSILGDTLRIPVIAKIGDEKKGEPLDHRQLSFNYRDVVSPRGDIVYVPYPELPKSLAGKTYVIEIKGPMGIPELLPGTHLYISRGLGNPRTLRNGDLAVYVNEEPDQQGEHRGLICRIRRDEKNDPDYIYFETNITPWPPPATLKFGYSVKKLAELVRGIDVVVAIVLRPDLLGSR